jgi:hypothetical protein
MPTLDCSAVADEPARASSSALDASMTLETLLTLLVLTTVPAVLEASDCSEPCRDSAPSRECDGMSTQVETTCSSTRCTINVKSNGNGGSESTTEHFAPSSSEAIVLCVGEPPCCITVEPCAGKTWSDVSSSCDDLCLECL